MGEGSSEPAITPVRRVSSRIAYRNPWLTVREDDIEYPDGTTSIYGIVEKPDFALVLPRGDGELKAEVVDSNDLRFSSALKYRRPD